MDTPEDIRADVEDATSSPPHSQQTSSDEKEFYSRIIQNAAAPMLVIDINHSVLFWNNALAKLTGKSSFQMRGTKLQWTPFYTENHPLLADLIIDQKLDEIDTLYKSIEASQYIAGAYRAEGWFENVGGKRRYLLFEAAPIKNRQNEITAAVETIEDITERKLAQEVLDNQHRFLQEILEAIPNPVFYKDTNNAFIGCNRAFSEFFGKTVQEVIGKTLADITPPERALISFAKDRQILESLKPMTYETPMLRCDGQERAVLVTKAPFLNIDGSLGGIVGTFVDVTEQRKLDEQIKAAKREWEETLDSLKDFVILTDAGHHIRRCNRLICDITGKGYEDVIAKDWRDILKDAGFSFLKFDNSSGELLHIRSQRSYDLTVYTMKDQNDLISGYVVSLNDTTEIRSVTEELKRTSQELNEAHKAVYQQEKMASIGQLAAGVAHEINNPMGFISSNLNTLGKYLEKINTFETAIMDKAAERCSAELSTEMKDLRKSMKIDFIMEDIRSLIDESRDGAERVRRIVQDLKSFSHVDEAECKWFSINECLDSTINMARNEIKYVADVELDYAPELPQISCYPQQLNQVFMNLLVNAAHAIEGHGTIMVSTRQEDDDIIVKISDTGKGIAPENLTRIFEPFFTTKEVGKGTGLGLSISYDIIKKHGGSMTVESEVGKGTTFTVRLPLDHKFESA